VHVAYLEARALAREPARSERRQAALVRQLGERIRLIHELRELRAAEERLNHGAHGARIDQIVERDALGSLLMLIRSLISRAMRRQADRELVGDQLADRAYPAVAEVVDVVGVAAAFGQLDQVADDRDKVVLGEDGVVLRHAHLEPLVDLVAPHPPQVVTLGMKEQALQRVACRLDIRRFAGPQQRVNLGQRFLPRYALGLEERVLDEGRLAPARR